MTGNCDNQTKCLICATPNINFLAPHLAPKLIEKHLKIMFLLRKVLEIPSNKLVNFLQGFPNIDDWISVCDKCETLVNQCKEFYQELWEVNRKFENGKQRIVKLVEESWSSNCNANDNKGTLDIFKQVRENVNNRKFY